MLVEIVRLPVPAGTQDQVVSYMQAAEYFGQTGLLSHRILVGTDQFEVSLILEWETLGHSYAAIESDIGRRFLAGLVPQLAGPYELAFYEPR